MTTTTIFFETITAAQKAYDTLQPMIDISIDCNAITFNESDKELAKWLVCDRYCQLGDRKIECYDFALATGTLFNKPS